MPTPERARDRSGGQELPPGPVIRFAANPGAGQPIPESVESELRPRALGNLDAIRLHTDAGAARAAASIGARAFTVGQHIGFGAGQFDPATAGGRHLIEHEAAHALAQAGSQALDARRLVVGGPADEAESAADHVAGGGTANSDDEYVVRRQPLDAGAPQPVDATADPLDAGAPVPEIQDAGAPYGAPAGVDQPLITFNGWPVPEDDAGLDQFFAAQVSIGGLNMARALASTLHQRLIVTDNEVAGAETIEHGHLTDLVPRIDERVQDLEQQYAAFRQVVLNATFVRLEGNREALRQWRDYLHTQVTPRQLRRQAEAEHQREVIVAAQHAPDPWIATQALERESHMTNPLQRAVEERVVRGQIHGACQYCHESVEASNLAYARPDLAQPTLSPAEALAQWAREEQRDPSPLPLFMTTPPDVGITQRDVATYPGIGAEVSAVAAIRPILRQLGPDGFQVIDPAMMPETLSDAELLNVLDAAIDARIADFGEFQRKLYEPGFDYLIPRPVLREVLPLASPLVRDVIQHDVEQAEADAEAAANAVGIVGVVALLLTIFPPTAAFGLALDIGLAGYGIYSGYQQYQQGQLLSLAAGSTVLDPEQQEAAQDLMASGALNMVMSTFGLAMSGLGAVRLLRTGSGAAASVSSVEADLANGGRLRIVDLNSSTPRVQMVDQAGATVVDQTLQEAELLEGPGTSGAGSTPPAGGAPPPSGPPPPGGLPPLPPPNPSSTQNVLVVGAETEAEFSYAVDVAQAGQPVTVVNPNLSPQAQTFMARGGNFVQAPIEDLPPNPTYTMIREDYPFPLGRAYPPTQEFAAARLDRLLPGGRWVVVTEDGEFVNTLQAAATQRGARVTVRQIPLAHEGTPVSPWPQQSTRFAMIIENPVSSIGELAPAEGGLSSAADTGSLVTQSAPGTAGAASVRVPPEAFDEALDALTDEANPFTLDVGARRMQDIQSGARDFVIDRALGFDIDEPLPVGAADVSEARAVQRALDPHNRQLLDPLTNQRTKYLGISQDTIARNRVCLEPVSVVDNPSALLTRRFDEVTEMNRIFDDAVSRIENPRSLTATGLKNRINQNIRRIIYDGLSPDGIRVRDALRGMGFELVPGRGMVMVRPPAP